jgi:hypothetical protein
VREASVAIYVNRSTALAPDPDAVFRFGGPAKRQAQASKRTRSLAEEEPTGTSTAAWHATNTRSNGGRWVEVGEAREVGEVGEVREVGRVGEVEEVGEVGTSGKVREVRAVSTSSDLMGQEPARPRTSVRIRCVSGCP